MMYYIPTPLPESGGQLLITSLTHNKKIVASSNTDIVLQCNLVYTLIITQYKHHIDDIYLHKPR